MTTSLHACLRFTLLCLCCLSIGLAQEVDSLKKKKARKLFRSNDMLELKLSLDMPSLLGDRGKDADYHEAALSWKDADGAYTIPVQVKARGNFRRDTANCEFPPLRMKFDKDASKGTLFTKLGKLKLVTHCQDENLILKEYLVYRMYNQLTDISFRVRLARITYQDSTNQIAPETKFAFFIEDADDMAKRNGCDRLKTGSVMSSEADRESTTRLYMFQYLIGNRDWDIRLQKNMKVIVPPGGEPAMGVPYDFDWSEIVGASYPQLERYLGNSFKFRKFRNLCRTPEEFDAMFNEFRDTKAALIDLYTTFEHISEKDIKKAVKYIEEFYEIIEDPKKVEKEFLQACRE